MLFKESDVKVCVVAPENVRKALKTLTGNRPFTKGREKALTKSHKKFSDVVCPILVVEDTSDGKLVIIDGEGRSRVREKLGLPVHFIVYEKLDMRTDANKRKAIELIQSLNYGQANWTPQNYLESYVELGVPGYIQLYNFQKDAREQDMNIAPYTLMSLFTGQQNIERFSDGTIAEIIDPVKARKRFAKIKDLRELYPGFLNARFVQVYVGLLEAKPPINHERLLLELRKSKNAREALDNASARFTTLRETILALSGVIVRREAK